VNTSTSRPLNRLSLLAVLTVSMILSNDSLAQDIRSTVADGDINVTLLATNLSDQLGPMTSQGEFSFAAWVEVGEKAFLFDTGWSPENVLSNARVLGIDLSRAEDLIVSHHHYDHVGGIETLRRELSKSNPNALSRIHVAEGMFASRPEPDGREDNLMIGIRERLTGTGVEFLVHKQPTEIAAGVWVSGPIPRVHAEKNIPVGAGWMIQKGDTLEPDLVPESQVLVIQSDGGPVVITGCGHAGLINSLEYAQDMADGAPPYAAIGGFHLYAATDDVMSWTAEHIKSLGLEYMIGAHCTGVEKLFTLREIAGLDRNHARVGSVGTQFNGDRGIKPGNSNK